MNNPLDRPRSSVSRAVIFDMDGVVIDTTPGFASAWKAAAEELGLVMSNALIGQCLGQNHLQIKQQLLNAFGPDFPLERFNERSAWHWYRLAEKNGIPLMPGFFTFLQHLRRYNIPYALATNSRHAYALDCLRFAGLEGVFENVITLDQVSEGKPAPEIFIRAARQIGCSPDEALIIEDSETGIRAALATSATTALIGLNREFVLEKIRPLNPHHCFQTLEKMMNKVMIVSGKNHISFSEKYIYLVEG